MDFKQHLIVAAKGAVVGGTMLVPGVSGGTMCIILGVYDRLIHAVSTFFRASGPISGCCSVSAWGPERGFFSCPNPCSS